MFRFINLTPQTPPSVIHGWKATDLLYEMVKTEKYFFGPVKRQIFGDALKQTFYMISKLVLCTKAPRRFPPFLRRWPLQLNPTAPSPPENPLHCRWRPNWLFIICIYLPLSSHPRRHTNSWSGYTSMQVVLFHNLTFSMWSTFLTIFPCEILSHLCPNGLKGGYR